MGPWAHAWGPCHLSRLPLIPHHARINPMDPIYVDLDDTLIHPEDRAVYPRPGAADFLRNLAKHGAVYIMSHAILDHVQHALPYLGWGTSYLSGIISREDYQGVINEVDRIDASPVSPAEKEGLRSKIPPVFAPGVIFDDWQVGSWIYRYKATTLGIGPEMWLKVPPYNPANRGDDALDRAYQTFVRKFISGGASRKRARA